MALQGQRGARDRLLNLVEDGENVLAELPGLGGMLILTDQRVLALIGSGGVRRSVDLGIMETVCELDHRENDMMPSVQITGPGVSECLQAVEAQIAATFIEQLEGVRSRTESRLSAQQPSTDSQEQPSALGLLVHFQAPANAEDLMALLKRAHELMLLGTLSADDMRRIKQWAIGG